jgi:hypothetical protein
VGLSPDFSDPFTAPSRFGNFRISPTSKATEGLNLAKFALKKAETEEDKKKADEMLVKALNEYFDQDLLQRKKELAEIKKKVEELEKQLQKRESSKSDIVDLQKKVIINEINGLGFYGAGSVANPANQLSGWFGQLPGFPPAPPSPAIDSNPRSLPLEK